MKFRVALEYDGVAGTLKQRSSCICNPAKSIGRTAPSWLRSRLGDRKTPRPSGHQRTRTISPAAPFAALSDGDDVEPEPGRAAPHSR